MDIIRKLNEELRVLEREYKHELPKVIREAASHGDLSENAEYDAARQRQTWVKARIAHLQARIQSLSLVDLNRIPRDRVGFGSTVTLEETESGETKVYRIVHPEEVDPARGLISVQSPVGQALLDKEEGEEVTVRLPAGTREYLIIRLVTIHDAEE
jgi:transcription elongation factor GreA